MTNDTTPAEPQAPSPYPERIPSELKALPHWVCWREVLRDGKATKPPYRLDGTLGDSTDPNAWSSFGEALEAYERSGHGFQGIGFTFSTSDPYAGVDLDHCRTPETGEIAAWAWKIIKALDSYTEVSPSGEGVHIIVKGCLPGDRHRTGNIEVYDRERYFTITGYLVEGTRTTIEQRQQALDAFCKATFGGKEASPAPAPSQPVSLDDKALLQKAFAAKNGAAFKQLWEGDKAGYPSASEADLALCAHLAFWTGADAARMDSLVRRSGLYRPKWDQRRGATTYGASTIAKALQGVGEVYYPAGEPARNGRHAAGVEVSPLPSAAAHAFESNLPLLPSSLWRVPIFGMIHNWLEPSLESPDAFIFGSSLPLVQVAVGRNVRFYAGRWLYTNDYSLLVGSTAVRKGLTYANLADELIATGLIQLKDGFNARVVTGFGSAEGLVEAFGEWEDGDADAGPRKKKSGKRNKSAAFKAIPERRVWNVEEEMGNLLVKMNRPGTANLRDTLCSLWDGADVEPLTRSKPVKAERPFYCILSMTTPDRLTDGASDLDFASGLLPRCMFFLGTPKEPIPFPAQPDQARAKAIAEELQAIHRHAETLRQRNQGALDLSTEARELWGGAYTALRQRANDAKDERTAAMRARVEVHVLKTAMLFAVCNRNCQIEAGDLELALELGEYLSATADIVAGLKFGHELKRLEDRVLRLLDAAGEKWLSVSDIHKSIGGKTPAHQLHQLLASMVALGIVEVPDNMDPRAPKIIRAKR